VGASPVESAGPLDSTERFDLATHAYQRISGHAGVPEKTDQLRG